MKFLADMGIPQSTIRWLRQLGYDAIHLREQGLQRLSDDKIIAKARTENRVILTCDLDFGALLAASGDKLPSVIIFRLENEKPDNINRRLAFIFSSVAITALEEGAIILVEQERHRIRLLPIE
jgi:predicted nuclease of predicted toxin-antitoxin system